jgi:nucleoside-diphosphate-sugar epimerase
VKPTIQTEDELENLLSEPTPAAVAALGRLEGDIVILGVSGKMGPTLARMARRASDEAGVDRRIIGVARFSSGDEARLESDGVETVRCDLLEDDALARLPDAPNVIFMTGMKFGTTGNEAGTWAMNTFLPGNVCRRYRRSRIVAFSTGNIYGLSAIEGKGSRETDCCQPVGEYAMSCLGRERLFEYFSRTLEIPTAIIRLNYAGELRYGVLVDLAQRVFAGEPIDLGMGYFNTLWQADANALSLCAFDHVAVPPCVLNVTGPEQLSTRSVAEQFGRLMNRPVQFIGTESEMALLSDARRGLALLGPPRVSAPQMIEWIADWVARGKRTLGKPTHYDSREGSF